ncbi:hypothetical protein ACH4T9_12690 [Micromonospora sp. NPDC020750]|uniref:hypothetical protein n=1 Tax=unclassified Micromonospora TaxID=2617518 RepID=UPI003797D12E
MSAVNLDVPPGTRLQLLRHEWRPNPADLDVHVWTVAVFTEAIGGYVWVRGHMCALGQPDCAAGWCWEAQVLVEAIRANLAGFR